MDEQERILSEDIYSVINKLMMIETKFFNKKDKYPNLHKAWYTTLKYKLEKMSTLLNQCENFCDNIDDTIDQDIPAATLALLYILNNNYLNK